VSPPLLCVCCRQALSADLKLVIDCDFDGKMNEGELRSLCQQLGYAYSSCVHGQPQAHLHLLGLKGCVLDMLQQKHGSYVNWAATTSQDSYAEYFKVRPVSFCFCNHYCYDCHIMSIRHLLVPNSHT
jgi:hypothetical protein